MTTLPLYDEVIQEFESTHPVKRNTVTIDGLGREVRVPTTHSISALIRPIGTNDLTRLSKDGSRYEDMIRIHCRPSTDLLQDDEVEFMGSYYRITKDRMILVSDFYKFECEKIIS